MSPSKRGKSGKLIVRVPSGVEATVLSSDLSVVSQLLPGESELTLPSGIYKVIARSADATQSRLVEVVRHETRVEKLDPVHFASPAPSSVTRKIHEYHEGKAFAMSRATPKQVGVGAQLFLLSRYWTGGGGREKRVSNAPHPLKGLSLHRIDGTLLLDVEAESQLDEGGPDLLAGLLVELDPGPYRLRFATDTVGAIEQCIVVCQGWQTQVFALVRDVEQGEGEAHIPDLGSAAILMAPSEQGFDPKADDLRLTEITRLSLLRRRALLDQTDRLPILLGKFENPMLGILGAHLIAREQPVPIGTLRDVIHNLRRLVGTHPDVEIIAARYLPESQQPIVFDTPPMLTSSWELISEIAANQESVVPRGSLSSGIASARWSSGIWLRWLLEELPASEPAFTGARERDMAGDAPEPQQTTFPASSTIEVLQKQLGRLSEKGPALTGIEEAVVFALQSASEGKFASRYLESGVSKAAPESKFDAHSLAKAFNMPATSMDAILTKLVKKLDE